MSHLFYNRVVYTQVTAEWMKEIAPEQLDAAEISGSSGRAFGFRSHQTFSYPEWNICAGPFRDASGQMMTFDVVLAEQVWEHLDYPYAATKHVLEMLRPGGFFWLAVPFFARWHAFPTDCSRWSARGLANLLVECGFRPEEIRAEQWGNRECGLRDMSPSWAIYNPQRDTLYNDPEFPVMSWAMARKV